MPDDLCRDSQYGFGFLTLSLVVNGFNLRVDNGGSQKLVVVVVGSEIECDYSLKVFLYM